MKKHFLPLLIVSLFLSASGGFAQQCATMDMYQENIKNDPTILVKIKQMEEERTKYEAAKMQSAGKTNDVQPKRIIPVVFHVFHEGGAENISKAQILDQIRILNECFQRRNADTAVGPKQFDIFAANSNMEFRLAKIDPNGNCTDGIVRVYTSLTNNANNNVKALSWWNTQAYLNIWVVKSIGYPTSAGTTLGYAQFPNGGSFVTDGVEIRHDVIGSVGTAGWNNNGHALVHEVGHWLSLYHTWGDDQGSKDECGGSDAVADTPNEQIMAQGCPSFPMYDKCTTTGLGVMFNNFMDYTNGQCQNIFTKGQKTRMDFVLDTTAGFRRFLISKENLIATGVYDTTTVVCDIKADFLPYMANVCANQSITFTDNSVNASAVSWNWSFPGGNPANSTQQNPTVTYANSGKYDVTLEVTNAIGNKNSITKTNFVSVGDGGYLPNTLPYAQTFESASFPENGWVVVNSDGKNGWQRTTATAYEGDACILMPNFTGNTLGQIDELITPQFDLSGKTLPGLSFRLSYAQRLTNYDKDSLAVYVSTTCGKTWSNSPIWGKSGANLALGSGGFGVTTSYLPPKNDGVFWLEVTRTLAQYVNNSNVRFKFVFRSGGGNANNGGNNLYIDNINVQEAVGLKHVATGINKLEVYPNPSNADFTISYELKSKERVNIAIYNAIGQQVSSVTQEEKPAGSYSIKLNAEELGIGNGVYFVRFTGNNSTTTQKLIIQ